MKELIEKYNQVQEKASRLYREIRDYKDGYLYITNERTFGSTYYSIHNNSFVVQQILNNYNGDNGIVDVYTNNMYPNLEHYIHDIIITSAEEMLESAKKDGCFQMVRLLEREWFKIEK